MPDQPASLETAAPPPEAPFVVAPTLNTAQRLQIRAEQIAGIYSGYYQTLIVEMVLVTVLVALLWDVVPHARLIVWTGLMVAYNLAGVASIMMYRRAAPAPQAFGRWGRLLVVQQAVSGCLWGVVGIIFFVPGAMEYQFLLLFVLIGLGAGSVAALTAYLPAFYAFFVPSMLPSIVFFALQSDRMHIVMAILSALYLVAVGYFAFTMARMLESSLQLRFAYHGLSQELHVQKDAAERANLAKSRFLAAASHDLRQPMHALGLFVAALQARIGGQPDVQQIVGNIEISVSAMNGLFNALLDISRLDAGTVEPVPAAFPVRELLQRLQAEYTQRAAEKGIRFDVVLSSAVVRSDPVLLQRILRNLVENAVRYTQSGRVLVGCRRCGTNLRIESWDTGPGIPQQHLQDIFQEFYQLHNPERDRSQGLGLGLAIVERLAHLLEHPLTVRSQPGKGSLFAVTVPLAASGAMRPDTAREPMPQAGLADAFIAVVDDEEAILEGMRSLLPGWGYRLLTATSGDEMLAKLAQCALRPDAIVCDYRLHGTETGVEVILRIQEEFNADIPGMLITGDTAPERLREAMASGFTLLHKPLQPDSLRTQLALLLGEKPVSG
jgi:signal transduction histidine kinase/CheY-like chemotaxis protein